MLVLARAHGDVVVLAALARIAVRSHRVESPVGEIDAVEFALHAGLAKRGRSKPPRGHPAMQVGPGLFSVDQERQHAVNRHPSRRVVNLLQLHGRAAIRAGRAGQRAGEDHVRSAGRTVDDRLFRQFRLRLTPQRYETVEHGMKILLFEFGVGRKIERLLEAAVATLQILLADVEGQIRAALFAGKDARLAHFADRWRGLRRTLRNLRSLRVFIVHRLRSACRRPRTAISLLRTAV